jgi:hypothetical protein
MAKQNAISFFLFVILMIANTSLPVVAGERELDSKMLPKFAS